MVARWRSARRRGVDAVGYGRPPKHSRFKPGQSGNPKGRPKGTRNFKSDVLETLRAAVNVTRNGKARRISTQAAALMRLREKALGGDGRALDRLLELARDFNNEELRQEAGLAEADKEILDIYRDRVLRGAAGYQPNAPRSDDEPGPAPPPTEPIPSAAAGTSPTEQGHVHRRRLAGEAGKIDDNTE